MCSMLKINIENYKEENSNNPQPLPCTEKKKKKRTTVTWVSHGALPPHKTVSIFSQHEIFIENIMFKD